MSKNEEMEKTKLKIIYTLHKKRHYNKRHTPIDFVCKRIPKIACKKIKKAINELDNNIIVFLEKFIPYEIQSYIYG